MRRIANNRPVSWSGVLWTTVVLVTAAVGFVACLQAEGERCQVNADCQDDLICCVGDEAEDVLRGGVCQQADKCVLVVDDAGVDDGDGGAADAGVGDAGVDAEAEADAPSGGDADAAVADAAVADTAIDSQPQQADSDVETGVADAGPDAPPADSQ